MKKKLLAFSLATLMLLSLAGCGGEKVENQTAGEPEEGKALPADAELNVVTVSHSSWPYNENWEVCKEIREGVGGKLTVNAYPESDFSTKFSLLMADTDNLPDVIAFQNISLATRYFEQGAFLAFDDNLEHLPNYEKFWNSVSPEEKANTYDIRRAADGKIYAAPPIGNERQLNVMAWLYRKDIFDKHNLKVPETTDELLKVCRKLKSIYPDSYPLGLRAPFSRINTIGSQWKPYFHYSVYYDFNNGTWEYGACEDTMLEIVTFLRKCYEYELVPLNYFTINTSEWENLIANDRSFITCDYQTRIDTFNSKAREHNPAFNLTAMKPPKADSATGGALLAKENFDNQGMAACNTGKNASQINAFRYIDWFYSDEGSAAVSWGKEGVTYEEVDGKRRFIANDGAEVRTRYGFTTIGTYLRLDPAAGDALVSEEQASTTDMLLASQTEHLNPVRWLKPSEEQAAKITELSGYILPYVEENLSKFLNGTKPLSEWDEFREGLNELPIDELLAVYDDMYQQYS
ncbi:MAG: extracellular solute-binding protein [Oscillospiraceae bacterium]|nr:extracellular solute-binding protein [Oscillospiraceae bacterium]